MTRYLTRSEIEYVLQDIITIPSIDKKIGNNIHSKVYRKFVTMLEKTKVYPEVIENLRKKLTSHYYSSQISAGESIGILTAQSIGERQTQLALDSFQSTGITTVTVVTGVPRFNELVNATKNPKNVLSTIYLRDKHHTIQDIRENAGILIKHLVFKDIITDTTSNHRHMYNFMIQNPDYDYKIIIELALLHRELDLVKLVLDFYGQNKKEFWNELLVNAAVTGEQELANYCILQGADNFSECFYCAKKYNNDNISNYIIDVVLQRNKENISNVPDINKLYENKQYNLVYDFFFR